MSFHELEPWSFRVHAEKRSDPSGWRVGRAWSPVWWPRCRLVSRRWPRGLGGLLASVPGLGVSVPTRGRFHAGVVAAPGVFGDGE